MKESFESLGRRIKIVDGDQPLRSPTCWIVSAVFGGLNNYVSSKLRTEPGNIISMKGYML